MSRSDSVRSPWAYENYSSAVTTEPEEPLTPSAPSSSPIVLGRITAQPSREGEYTQCAIEAQAVELVATNSDGISKFDLLERGTSTETVVQKEPSHPEGFAIGLFDMGDITDCILACFCPCIATSFARSSLDGSPFFFNFYCLNTPITRWAVRTGYGIDGGGCVDDIILPCLCIPCSANQVYQTTKRYGPLVTGGRQHNIHGWINPVSEHFDYGSCCYAFCCPHCAAGSALSDSMGMPWLLGCLCGNCYGARNLIRYHYRIEGMDVAQDCALPFFGQGCCCILGVVLSAATFGFCAPCILPLTAGPIVAFQMTLLQEARARSVGPTPGGRPTEDFGRYIAGYSTVSSRV